MISFKVSDDVTTARQVLAVANYYLQAPVSSMLINLDSLRYSDEDLKVVWLFKAVSQIPYTPDPEDKERIFTPDELQMRFLEYGLGGDCDDLAVLLTRLLREAGVDADVVIIDADATREFNHALVQVKRNGGLFLDPASRIYDAKPSYTKLIR